MELRRLKGLIRTLKAEGVAEFEETPDGGVRLRFADASPVFANAASTDGDTDMDLPPGVLDPRAAIAAIYKRKQPGRLTA